MTRFLLTTRLVVFACENEGVTFASPRTLYRRLNKLRKAGLIERSRLLHTGEYGYHLTKQGEELITGLDDTVHQSHRSCAAPSITLQAHEFDVSRFWLKFFSDSKKLHIPTRDFWRDGSFIYEITPKQKLIPDGTVVLTIKGRSRVFFLELDRSTQTSGRGGNTSAIIRQKLARYRHLSRSYRNHPQLSSYHPQSMRVMFVCKTQQRAQSLLAVARDMGLGDVVCFTSLDRFLTILDPFTAQGWEYCSANIFAAPLFLYPARSPPQSLL